METYIISFKKGEKGSVAMMLSRLLLMNIKLKARQMQQVSFGLAKLVL